MTASTGTDDLERIVNEYIDSRAQMAHKIMDVGIPVLTVIEYLNYSTHWSVMTANETLNLKVDKLTAQMNLLNGNHQRSASRGRHHFRSRASSPSTHRGMCWYHHRYGAHAHQCREA